MRIGFALCLASVAVLLALPWSGALAQSAPTLTIPDTEKLQVIKFGFSRDATPGGFSLDPQNVADPKSVPVPRASVRGDMVSEEGERIRRAQVTVPTITPNGTGGLDVDVLVDPGKAPPGRYTTTVQFGGSGYSGILPVTIEARLKAHPVLAIALALLGFVLGVGLKVVSDLFGAAQVGVARKTLGEWLKNGGWPMLASGAVGAGIAWAAAYLPNDTWGATPSDLLTLVGTAMAVSVAGSEVGDLAKGLTGKTPSPNPGPA